MQVIEICINNEPKDDERENNKKEKIFFHLEHSTNVSCSYRKKTIPEIRIKTTHLH